MNLEKHILMITTQAGCGVACTYCPQDVFAQAYRARSSTMMMSLDVFRQCLDKLPRQVAIHFSGFSEPTLNPAWLDMVSCAHSKGHRVRIFSTLAGMTERDARELESLSSQKGSPGLNLCVHLPSLQGFETIHVDDKYLATLRALLAGSLEIDNFHCYHGGVTDEIGVMLQAHGRRIFQDRKPATRAGNVAALGNRPSPFRRIGHIGCRRGFAHNVLLPNGEVALCCLDFGLRHILGNLLHLEYGDLFAGTEYSRVISGLQDSKHDILCRYCDEFLENRDWTAKLCNFAADAFRLALHNVKKVHPKNR